MDKALQHAKHGIPSLAFPCPLSRPLSVYDAFCPPQVEPFNIHINPSILLALTAYVTPVPPTKGSSEALESPFPYSARVTPTLSHSSYPVTAGPASSALATDDRTGGGCPRSLSGVIRELIDSEKPVEGAAASMKFLASQVSLVLSSYPGGPAFIATTSHIFMRAITRPPGRAAVMGGRHGHEDVENEEGMIGGRLWRSSGPEGFARVSQVSCKVDCCYFPASQSSVVPAAGPQQVLQVGETVLKPFDVDLHITHPESKHAAVGRSGARLSSTSGQGWFVGVNVDELYVRFGVEHVRSLNRLAELFVPALATAKAMASLLSIGPGSRTPIAGTRRWIPARSNDLRVLERVESVYSFRRAAVKPRAGEAVCYTIVASGMDVREDGTGVDVEDGSEWEDGWVMCCEWQYWGLRRVAQIALPQEPLSGRVPLLEGVTVDSLEVELSFADPLSGKFKVRFRWSIRWFVAETRRLGPRRYCD